MQIRMASDLIATEAIMTHNGKELVWNISPFERTDIGENDAFAAINSYWSNLPIEVQDHIFELYSKIFYEIESNDNIESMTKGLQELIFELIERYHTLEQVEYWCIFKSNIIIPSTIMDTIQFEQGGSATADKTYVKKDYQKLVAMAVLLKAMIPIWGEFIFRTRNDCGTTFKEMYAARLLAKTSILVSEPAEKLKRYIMKQLPPDKTIHGAILAAINTDEYPNFMLARVIVRRLCVGDITGYNPSSTLLTFIYKYIRQKSTNSRPNQKLGNSSNFNDNVRTKFSETDSEDGENKLSKLESYKIPEKLSRGDVVIFRNFFNDPYAVMAIINKDIPKQLLTEALESVKILQHEVIYDSQIAIIKWVLKKAINPKAISTLEKINLLKAIAIAQTVLWFNGHYELAAIVSSYSRKESDHKIFTVESRMRVSREYQEKIKQLFPYSKSIGKNKATAKLINPALTAIDVVSDHLSNDEWNVTLPQSWLENSNLTINNRKFVSPLDIRNKLAALIIQLVDY